MVRVSRVEAGGIGEQLGVVPGTELLSVNGRDLSDFLDWEFLSADDELVVEARLPGGERVVYDVARPERRTVWAGAGTAKHSPVRKPLRILFIEGLPKGLRKSLYVRDDDYRLSFAYGNFATLSNLKDHDFERILEYRLSPLYVSVHATPWDARKALLNNPRVPNILEQLQRLVNGGIQFHGQMVIVPGLNDGAVLEESLTDLWGLGEACLSVALVPVGLTQFSHLYTGKSMSAEHARGLLETADRWARRARVERDHAWVFGSDELYLLANRELPSAEHYGDFPQVENGVGAVAALRQRVTAGAATLPRLPHGTIGVVTGFSMAPLLPPLLSLLEEQTGVRFEIIRTESSLFGPTTTTAGLLVGADIRRALEGRNDLDLALIPAETINDQGIFLDDEPFAALRDELSIPVLPSYDFIDVLGNLNGAFTGAEDARRAP